MSEKKTKKDPYARNTGGPTMTKQSFADQCDINRIVSNFQKTGFVDHARKSAARYGDQTELTFFETQTAVANIKSIYEGLNVDRRGLFESVYDFINAVADPTQTSRLIEAGLLPEAPSTIEPYDKKTPKEELKPPVDKKPEAPKEPNLKKPESKKA